MVIAAMRAPFFRTPPVRFNHSPRWTSMPYSRTRSSNTCSATCGSKIHIVRCAPSIAGVPWPLLPYSSRFCHFHAAGLSYCAQMRW